MGECRGVVNRPPSPSPFAEHWLLDPEVVYLNHGSFGAAPKAVLDVQTRIRELMEAEPVRFFMCEFPEALDRARAELGAFVGASPENLAFVANATTGVNTVLRSLDLAPGDELLVTDHEYNACRNAVDAVAAEAGGNVVVAALPFPLESEDRIVEEIVDRVTDRTRLLLVDHVTSQTALVLPLERIVAEMRARNVEVLVDGAHAPGMIDLDVDALGVAYYTGNCHKWLCAPKGAAFLYVRSDLRSSVRPLVISHGANAPSVDRSLFRLEHDWTGTRDPSAWMCVPAAIRVMGSMLPGGWSELRRRNRELALGARELLCEALEIDLPCPESMIGSFAALPLPDDESDAFADPFGIHPLQKGLYERFRIEVPVISWPAPPDRLVRISAQLYNSSEQYVFLAEALTRLLG
jgi:isopenicillin-N epimerase